MENNQAAKSVLKKLSALRATLSDTEQTYLDQLILGMGTAQSLADPPGPEDNADDRKATGQQPGPGNPALLDQNSPAEKITWNKAMEVYELD